MKKKTIIILVVVIATVLTAAGVTVAFLSEKSAPVENEFITPVNESTLNDVVSNDAKTQISVTNNSEFDVYVRVAVVANKIDADGNITDDYNVSSYLNGNGWAKIGDFYYYTSKVTPDQSTGNLVSTPVPLTSGGNNYQVAVMSETIQANPASAVQESWGVSVDRSGNITG